MASIDSSVLLREVLNDEELVQLIGSCKLLMVGSGGIGCEVIKDLLLMGFKHMNMIDLDTIDVSNLNRQFLFNKTHIGKSKAQIAAQVAVSNFAHNDSVTVNPIHNSIQMSDFDIDFFKSHSLVINALDNRAARSHVNRMCLAADVPLIESGSEGYMGQVFFINKGMSACYECDGPKLDGKTYASCTIRNTPSLPIHCIVWAKHLFSQLFGEEDADNDVSPDMNDPELAIGSNSTNNESTGQQSTRSWAQSHDYDTKQLFDKLFSTDINYLLKMDKLWENRRKPVPLNYDEVYNNQIELNGCEGSSLGEEMNGSVSVSNDALKDQKLWSLNECLKTFDESLKQLKNELNDEKYLVWDKDSEPALNFVTAVSNLRSYCFSITRKSKFDVKSMAGNIIPAISSTNSIVGGLIVLQCLNILRNLKSDATKIKEVCKHIYVRKVGPSAKNVISSYDLQDPNPNCLVCCSGQRIPEIEISLSLNETTISDFIDQIILGRLHFVCPDIQIDGQPIVLFSKEDYDDESVEEKARIQKKLLSDYPFVKDKIRFRIYDLIQNHTIIVTLRDANVDKNENDGMFYKMVITKEGDSPSETIEEKTDNNDNVIPSHSSEMNAENKVVENLNTNKETIENIIIEDSVEQLKDEMEVIDSDSDNPVIVEDVSNKINEMREKRKLGNKFDDSVIKKVKS